MHGNMIHHTCLLGVANLNPKRRGGKQVGSKQVDWDGQTGGPYPISAVNFVIPQGKTGENHTWLLPKKVENVTSSLIFPSNFRSNHGINSFQLSLWSEGIPRATGKQAPPHHSISLYFEPLSSLSHSEILSTSFIRATLKIHNFFFPKKAKKKLHRI